MSALQRLAAAACGGGSGLLSIRLAPAAADSRASSSALWQRAYSDAAGGSGDKPAEQPDTAAAAAEPAAAGAADAAPTPEGEQLEAAEPEPADIHPALIDPVDGSAVPPELFTKRQLAWMGVEDPERYKHFLPRLARKELGSFADEYVAEEFDVEQELYPAVPDVPLYDLRAVVPEIYDPRSEVFERLRRLKAAQHPSMPVEQWVQEVVGINAPEHPPSRPGARKIIRWQVRHVLAVGVSETHPASRKVKAWVYLRDLQREHGLTDAALQHIAAVCGPRYNPHKGELKLTSDRHPHREANRAHILQILKDLVAEGHRKFPAEPQQQQQQQQQAAAP